MDATRHKSFQQHTNVVEANFQGLVTAERSVSQADTGVSPTERCGYKITASEVGLLG